MFTARLTRVAHRAVAAASSSSASSPAPLSTSSASAAATCVVTGTGQSHQRRPSSSKASCPPDSNSSNKQAPAVKTAEHASSESHSQTQHHLSSPTSARHTRRTTRGRRVGPTAGRKADAKKQNTMNIDPVADLPVVPVIPGLYEHGFKLSNFFSLHRPMSITPGQIPPPATAEAFSSIFTNQTESDAWADGDSSKRKPEDVIYTLNRTIEDLEDVGHLAEGKGVRWEVMKEGNSNNMSLGVLTKFDGSGPPRMKTAEELAATFAPFKAPPPPVPFGGPALSSKEAQSSDKKAQTQQRQRAVRTGPKQKSYTTTIVVTESTALDGQRTYSATSSPMVRLPDPEPHQQKGPIREPTPIGRRPQQPFLERMQRRQRATFSRWMRIENPTGRKKLSMLLISVKRQRKLKMKKHKYKKLMKRTRNLRRRLDRV